jgi:hypothetical protein
MTMKTRLVGSMSTVLALAIGAAPAAADVTGSYDGAVTAKKLPAPVAIAAVFSQAGTGLSGTVALPADVAVVGGEYLVVGKATPKRVRVSGFGPGGAKLVWRAKILGDTLTGKLTAHGHGGKVAGLLAMTRNVSTSDGSGCDAVYTANQSTFDDQVMGVALTACTECHAEGLQAGATRLHVSTGDKLATARAVALMIDSADPSSSRILQKPLNLVPHGGGQRIDPGSTEEQVLTSWVELVAAAHCN